MVKDNHDRVDQLQMNRSRLEVSKCALEEDLLSSSHRAQVAENQIEVLIIRLAELQQKFKSQSQRVSAIKVRALIGKEWDPVTGDMDAWEEPTEAKNFKLSDSQGFISPKEVVSALRK